MGEISELLEPRRRETLAEQVVRKVERTQGGQFKENGINPARYEAVAEVESGDPTRRSQIACNALPPVAAVGARLPMSKLGGAPLGVDETFLQPKEGGALVREASGHGG